jgi:iron complex transport system substrate-binding protein
MKTHIFDAAVFDGDLLRTIKHLLERFLLILICFTYTAHAEIRLTDSTGQVTVLQTPAQRIVSLAPHLTEIVFAAGAGRLLVGTMDYSDYPEAAKGIPRIGSYNRVSYESIIALNPDLVVAWNGGNDSDIIARLRTLGLTVFVAESNVLEDVATSLTQIGILSGTNPIADNAAEEFLEKLKKLRNQYSHTQTVKVFYQVWNEPMMTLNGKHLISDLIELCGGYNIFADALPLVPKISTESVIRANPQAIIASGMDIARPEWLDDWKQWASIQAVKNKQLYFVPPDLLQRHTPRILEGTTLVCEHLAKARKYYSNHGG